MVKKKTNPECFPTHSPQGWEEDKNVCSHNFYSTLIWRFWPVQVSQRKKKRRNKRHPDLKEEIKLLFICMTIYIENLLKSKELVKLTREFRKLA